MKSRKRPEKNKETAWITALNLLSIKVFTPKNLELKLIKYGFEDFVAVETIKELIARGLLDENAYAKDFVRAKLALNSWGSYKIKNSMMKKKFSESAIKDSISAIEKDDEVAAAKYAISRKFQALDMNEYSVRQKATLFLKNRGFSYDIIKVAINPNNH